MSHVEGLWRQALLVTLVHAQIGSLHAGGQALADRQRQLADARETLHTLSQRAAEARASQAALSERSVAVARRVDFEARTGLALVAVATDGSS